MQEIGEELLGHPEALGTFRLGILRMKQNIHPADIELKVPADGEGGDAAPAYRPEAEEGQNAARRDIGSLVACGRCWQSERLVHELDAEVESYQGRHQPVEAVLGMSTRGKA